MAASARRWRSSSARLLARNPANLASISASPAASSLLADLRAAPTDSLPTKPRCQPSSSHTAARARPSAPSTSTNSPLCSRSRSHSRSSSPSRQPFHTYFVTHLPSSSLHPESSVPWFPNHKMPREASTPHTPGPPGSASAVALPQMRGRDLTVVRIPLRRAKHHFGSFSSRGSRPYNEDADQAGIVDIPAFARRGPMTLKQNPGEATPAAADNALGDPQVFYFGVFDGHGGSQCSQFLRDELHGYIEKTALEFGLESTLRKKKPGNDSQQLSSMQPPPPPRDVGPDSQADSHSHTSSEPEADTRTNPKDDDVQEDQGESSHASASKHSAHGTPAHEPPPVPAEARSRAGALRLQQSLVAEYGKVIGGYFKRFSPENFQEARTEGPSASASAVESSLTYAFLRADLDFVAAQARKSNADDSDLPLNHDEILGAPHATPLGHGFGGPTRFTGGSTASVSLISTPTPTPFWHPAARSTLLVAHVGDSRILLCETATGRAQPLTSDHHPTTPTESRRLRRYAPAGVMVTGDSFGEERIAGLANSRAFGDMGSKRIGVSAEPETARVELAPAQYSFLVLVTDGVSATLSDQEIVDVVKEARTPEQGARCVVEYATEVSTDGDNATCQVVRLGGWERRLEGGVGSLGTREIREARRAEALDPRRREKG